MWGALVLIVLFQEHHNLTRDGNNVHNKLSVALYGIVNYDPALAVC